MTSSGTSEAGYIALSEAVEEVLVLGQEVQNLWNCRCGCYIIVGQGQAY